MLRQTEAFHTSYIANALAKLQICDHSAANRTTGEIDG